MSTLDDIRGLSAYELAGVAGCATPDSPESPGALLLTGVRDAFVEAVADGRIAAGDADGAVHEIADGAPDVYIHTRWSEFLDLAAYQEDPETGEWPDDLTAAAGVALYQIADRLVRALADDLEEEEEEEEEEEGDDVPADFPVRVLGPDDSAADRVTCGECGRSWDDAVVTSMTPAPSARCPFEAFH